MDSFFVDFTDFCCLCPKTLVKYYVNSHTRARKRARTLENKRNTVLKDIHVQ